MQRRLIVPLIAFAGCLLLLGATAATLLLKPRQDSQVALIGGPFSLKDQKGRPVTSQELAGKPFAVFFGFTHCPDVCPTTLFSLSEDMKALGADADKLRIFFVSVDPERDTPDLLSTYLDSFDPRITGLVGTSAEIEKLAKDYRAYYRKVPVEGGDYTMEHTATVFLMDRKGRFFLALDFHDSPEARRAKLKRLIAEG